MPRRPALRAAFLPSAALAALALAAGSLAACGVGSKSTAGAPGASSGAKAAPPAPEPYSYPPPVSGHYSEVNTGDFDLVDGLATPNEGGGYVVLATSKPIGSPLLAGSACPRIEARSLIVLRDAAWLEAPTDAKGKSAYFASGTIFNGQSYEENVGGGYWKIDVRESGDHRVAGQVRYSDRGGYRFDLPLYAARVPEVSEGERVHGRQAAGDVGTPDAARARALYEKLRDAARARDLGAFLAAQGFSDPAIRSLRGLAGIEADFAALADRFLSPGEPGESNLQPGLAGIGAEGTNSKGEKFINYYELAPCGDRLVLVGIGENPQ
ncbi:MAG: hypothetical protein U0X73_03870 [Thermoanaerobaculia bacterium]